MAGLPRTEEQNLIRAWFGLTGTAYVAPTLPIKMGLTTSAGSDTAAGTAVAGGGYAPATLAIADPTAGSPSTTSNSSAVNYTNMPATTTTGIEVTDSAGTPARKAFAALTASKTTGAGDTLSFAIGAVTASLG